MPASTPTAIVFDKDGVLIDFVARWAKVAQLRAQHLALQTGQSPEALLAVMGVPGGNVDPYGPLAVASRSETRAVLAGCLYREGMNWLEAIQRVEEAFAAGDTARHVRVAPGPLVEPLKALRQLGIRLAIATTDTTEGAHGDVAGLGLEGLFEAVWGADRVSRNKPHPDLFLGACAELGAEPHQAWMVGDSLADLRMGRAGGAARVIGVTSGLTARAILAAEADAVLAGVWELPSYLRLSSERS